MELHVVNTVVLAAPGIDVLIIEPNKLVRLILIIFFFASLVFASKAREIRVLQLECLKLACLSSLA